MIIPVIIWKSATFIYCMLPFMGIDDWFPSLPLFSVLDVMVTVAATGAVAACLKAVMLLLLLLLLLFERFCSNMLFACSRSGAK